MENDRIWLKATFSFPTAYSIKVPGSSMTSACALPAPGPGTIRLAIIRTAIEFFGLDFTRKKVFPNINNCEIAIQPPSNVAISQHFFRMHKIDEKSDLFKESIGHREYCQSFDNLSIFLYVQLRSAKLLGTLLQGIGYWGETDSVVQCISTNEEGPNGAFCIQPVVKMDPKNIPGLFVSFLTDLRRTVTCDEVFSNSNHLISLELFAFPYEIQHKKGGDILLAQRSLYLAK